MEAHNCLYKRVEKLRTTHATYKVVRASVIHLIHKEKTAPEGREKKGLFIGFGGPPVWRRGRWGPTEGLRTRLLRILIFADVDPYVTDPNEPLTQDFKLRDDKHDLQWSMES